MDGRMDGHTGRQKDRKRERKEREMRGATALFKFKRHYLMQAHETGYSFIHSFISFIYSFIQAIYIAPFKSTNAHRRSRHSTADTVSEFHVEAPQATASEGLASVAARAGLCNVTSTSYNYDNSV